MDGYSIVLTEKLAKKLFGEEDAMGKQVKVDNRNNYTVTGILKDPPPNSRFQFEYLLPWAALRREGGDDINWGNNSTQTFVLLKENAKLATINAKLGSLRERYDKNDPTGGFFFIPT